MTIDRWLKTSLQTLALLLAFMQTAVGQSVEDLIEMTVARNPTLKALQLEYEAALEQVDQVKQWPDPVANLGLGILPIETRLGAQHLRVGIGQSIPWPGLLDAKGDLARAKAQESFSLDQLRRIDIEFAVRKAYSELIYLHSEREIIGDRLLVIDALEEMTKSAVRTNKGHLSDVLMVERKRESLIRDQELLDRMIERPTILLNRWAGRELKEPVLPDTSIWIIPSNLEIVEFAERQHPQYQILADRINTSKAEQKLNSIQSRPKLSLGLDYGLITRRKGVEIDNNGRDVLMPTGSISIPLNKRQFSAKQRQEEIKQRAIESISSELAEELTAQIEVAYSTITYLREMVEKWIALQQITSETLELLRSEYSAEGTRFEELLRLEMEMIDYEQKIQQAYHQRRLQESVLLKFKRS